MARRVAPGPVLNAQKSIVNLVVGRWVDPRERGVTIRKDGKAFLEEGHALGFVFKESRWVMTCSHVVRARQPDEVIAFAHADPSVMRSPGPLFRGASFDIALLRFAEPFDASPVSLPAAGKMIVSQGDEAFFWSSLMKVSSDGARRGFMLGLRHTMISAIHLFGALEPDQPIPCIALIDSVVPGGSSGSPLVRPDGTLIGMIFEEEVRPVEELEIPSGLGRAIPIDAIVAAATQLAESEGISELE